MWFVDYSCLYVCVGVCGCVCVVCVWVWCVCVHACVCVRACVHVRVVEREREREESLYLYAMFPLGDDVLFLTPGSQTLVTDRMRDALQMAGLV